MTIHLRPAQQSDLPFLQKMLYEAVFWRMSADKPSFEEALAMPDVSKALADWGERAGDTCVVATIQSAPVGAAWYRYWTDNNTIRGYVDEQTPVVVIGVHSDYRHQGIGGKMLRWLIESAVEQALQRISLAVSKDNYALNLYRQQGFQEYTDTGNSFIMVRNI